MGIHGSEENHCVASQFIVCAWMLSGGDVVWLPCVCLFPCDSWSAQSKKTCFVRN